MWMNFIKFLFEGVDFHKVMTKNTGFQGFFRWISMVFGICLFQSERSIREVETKTRKCAFFG